MQITINLCSTPYLDVGPLLRKLRLAVVLLASLIAIAGSLLVLAHFHMKASLAEERQLDGIIVRKSDELSGAQKLLSKPENVSMADRVLALNSLFEEKSFSWTMLMKDFEGLVPNEVQLATIQPVREKDGSISIHMHVVGPRAKVVELLHGLELSRSFTNTHVTAEAARSDTRPGQHSTPLTAATAEEFDIQMGYDQDAPRPVQRETTGTADRQTAITEPADSMRGKITPSQLTATASSRTGIRPEKLR